MEKSQFHFDHDLLEIMTIAILILEKSKFRVDFCLDLALVRKWPSFEHYYVMIGKLDHPSTIEWPILIQIILVLMITKFYFSIPSSGKKM